MNNIVYETTGELKNIAKKRLEGYWGKMTLAMIVLSVLVDIIPQILTILTPESLMFKYEDISLSYVSNLYDFFTTGAFSAGMCSLMLVFFRERETHPGHLFNGYEYYFKTFSLMIIKGVFIAAWSLLFIIPGIIAAFSYSQAYYILAEHPEKGIMQCLRESKIMMNGNKSKYFVILLSFFGYYFLIAMIQGILLQMKVNSLIISFVILIPAAALAAYVGTTETAFYEILTGHLKGRAQMGGYSREVPREVPWERKKDQGDDAQNDDSMEY